MIKKRKNIYRLDTKQCDYSINKKRRFGVWLFIGFRCLACIFLKLLQSGVFTKSRRGKSSFWNRKDDVPWRAYLFLVSISKIGVWYCCYFRGFQLSIILFRFLTDFVSVEFFTRWFYCWVVTWFYSFYVRFI